MADPISLGITAGLFLIQTAIALLSPKPKPPRVDTRIPTATAGEDVYLIWGTVRLSEIRIWSIPLQKENSGGKGLFAGTPNTQYYATYATMFNRSVVPVNGIVRLWLNKKIKMDLREGIDQTQQTGTIGGEERTSVEFANAYINFHYGGVNDADSVIEENSDNDHRSPNYLYRTYLTIHDLPVTDEFGNNSPAIDAEISVNGDVINSGAVYGLNTQEPIQWVSQTGITSFNQLTKSTSTLAYDVSGVTGQRIENNGGSTFYYVNGSRAIVGLTASNQAPTSVADIIYAIEVDDTDVNIIEFGTTVSTHPGVYFRGSELTIRVNEADHPIYAINSNQLYESLSVAMYPLFGSTFIYTPNTFVSGDITSVSLISENPIPIVRLNSVAVADIIRDLYFYSGIDPNILDLSEIDYLVPGCRHGSKPARELVQQLMQAFFLEVIELGGKIKFQKSQRPSISAIIPLDDLGAYEGDTIGEVYVEDIADPLTLPTEVKVLFTNQLLDYDRDQADFRDASSPNPSNLQTIDFDLLLHREWAENVARIWTYLPHIERYTYKFSLPPKYLYLLPGDVVTIPVEGRNIQVKLTKREVGANFIVSFEAKGYESSIYDEIGFDAPIAPPAYATNQVTPIIGTQFRVLDIPLISDIDPDLGFYVVANGEAGWNGGALYVSRDGGANYLNATGLTARPFGRCLGVLGDAIYGYVDYANTLMVDMNFGALFNSTNTVFFSDTGSQLVAVGNNTNGWEIIAYRYADPGATDTQYTINTLRRGLFGTENQIGTHKAGEYFIPLQVPIRVPVNQADLGLERLFKGVTLNQPIDVPNPITERYNGRDVMPYAPTALQEVQSGVDLALSWHRRDRKTSNLITWVSVPLNDPDRYRLRIYNGSSVVRTEMVEGVSYTYTEANQIADFGSVQESVNYDVAQTSNYGSFGSVARFD